MKEKALIIIVCAAGLLAVFYGMYKDHDVIFVVGLVFVIGGYLAIRKKLKASLREKR